MANDILTRDIKTDATGFYIYIGKVGEEGRILFSDLIGKISELKDADGDTIKSVEFETDSDVHYNKSPNSGAILFEKWVNGSDDEIMQLIADGTLKIDKIDSLTAGLIEALKTLKVSNGADYIEINPSASLIRFLRAGAANVTLGEVFGNLQSNVRLVSPYFKVTDGPQLSTGLLDMTSNSTTNRISFLKVGSFPQGVLGYLNNSVLIYNYARTTNSTTSNVGFICDNQGRMGINKTPIERLDVNGNVNAVGYKTGYLAGVSGSFTSNDGKTITVTNGLITNIV